MEKSITRLHQHTRLRPPFVPHAHLHHPSYSTSKHNRPFPAARVVHQTTYSQVSHEPADYDHSRPKNSATKQREVRTPLQSLKLMRSLHELHCQRHGMQSWRGRVIIQDSRRERLQPSYRFAMIVISDNDNTYSKVNTTHVTLNLMIARSEAASHHTNH
ncbi:hypothetical protein M758_11G153100 [Ceratodon purpureus]|nr:hypothetical protein M758_11G153100 [Ceratodon purpureus]